MRDFALLCYPLNAPVTYDANTPLSILALGAFLEENGVEVEYYDARVHPRERLGELAAREPRVVGVSVMGGYQIASAARLSRLVREVSPGSAIVWGGVHPTILPEITIREPFVDYLVIGEGEETLLKLFRALGRGPVQAERVRGIVYEREGRVERTPPRPPPDVERLPFVYRGKALELLERYLGRRSIREYVGYEVSRGCPFQCSFCYSPKFHGETRVKSAGKVARELEELERLGARDIDIYDDTIFGARRQEFAAYLELLERHGFAWIGNLRVNMLDRELLDRIKAAGCRWLYFGIESSEDDTLRAIKEGISSGDVRSAVRLMSGSGLSTVYSVIHGLPLDGGKEDLDRCLDFVDELRRLHPEAEVQIQSFVPLPGTALYAEALKLGFKPPETLMGWVGHGHFSVALPWLPDPRLSSKLYLSSFLAFRYRRHLSHFPANLLAYPLHLLSRLRFRYRFFGLHIEQLVLDALRKLSGAK